MEEKIAPKNTVFSVIAVQFVAVMIIVLSVFCFKTFYKPAYEKIADFYNKNLRETTDINEFFEYFNK